MIRPPGTSRVVFTEAADGDQRADRAARRRVSDLAGISADWAMVTQVHGASVVEVGRPGVVGPADALWTSVAGLPLAVLTADCFGVVLRASDAVGVAHVGWRGAAAGVTAELRSAMEESGHTTISATIGPGIGSCCFEVGTEVSESFSDFEAKTTWDTDSVDLRSAIMEGLGDLETVVVSGCTRHDPKWYSHRRDQTRSRLATIGWI